MDKKRKKITIDQIPPLSKQVKQRIPEALLQMQSRGFMLPQAQLPEVDELSFLEGQNLDKEENGHGEKIIQHFNTVLQQHQSRMEQGFSDTKSFNSSSNHSMVNNSNEKVATSSLSNFSTSDKLSLHSFSHFNRNNSVFHQPQDVLQLLSGSNQELGERTTMGDMKMFSEQNSTEKKLVKVEIGKLIEQVTINAQDISEGSEQLVKTLKAKLIEILQDELKTTY